MVRDVSLSNSLIMVLISLSVMAHFEGPTRFVLWILTQGFMCPMETEAQKATWLVMGYALLRCAPWQSFVFLFYMAQFRSGKLHYFLQVWTDYLFWKLQKSMDEIKMSFQVYGENSEGYTEYFVGEFLKYYNSFIGQENFMDKFWGTVEAYKLRPLEITEPAIDYTNKDFHHPGRAKELAQWAQGLQRMGKIGLLAVAALMIGSSGVPALLIFALIVLHGFTGSTEIIRRKPKAVTPIDGVYHVRSYMCGILWESSIGVCVNGVMHATYHATGDKALKINNVLHRPTYVDIERDIVTWGGEPQMEKPRKDLPVYALINRLSGQTTYKIDVQVVGRDAAWPKVTEPGESGSPIVMSDGGKLILVALAGNHVTYQGKATEFGIVTEMRPEQGVCMQKGVIHVIAAHPGSGKTFRTIPKICKDFVEEQKGIIVVAGPTRVVCKEIYASLMSQMDHGLVGAMVKKLPRINMTRARVVVIAHATLAQFILDEHPIVKRIKAIIIDESHVDDKATELLKVYAQEMTGHGQTGWFLSATHPGQISSGANFNIIDEQVNEHQALRRVDALIEEGKRVILFTPGIKGELGTTKMANRFRDHKPIVLNSQTYEREKRRLDDKSNMLIITTNIAECGMNAEADVVIDLCKNFFYTYNSGVVQGVMSTISRASRVQRRGRVGRIKDGHYIYTEEPKMDYRLDTAEKYDAHLMVRQLPWYTGGDYYPSDPGISRKQSSLAMEKSLPPKYVSLIYDRLGIKRHGEDLNDAVNDWLAGHVKYEGCGKRNCKCAGTYTFWDERVHDELVHLKTGEPAPRRTRLGWF